MFDRGASELLGKMSWLGFDMTTSATLKKLLKEADARLKAQAQGSDTIIEAAVVVAVQLTSQTEEDDALAQADAEPASKKRRVPTSKGAKKPKAGPKAKAKSRAAPCQVREPDLCHLIIRSTDTDSRGMYDERPRNALDDLIQAIRNRSVAETYVLDEVPEPQDKATFAFCASIGLEFIFSKKVAVNGKGFAVYAGLRPELGGIRHAGTLPGRRQKPHTSRDVSEAHGIREYANHRDSGCCRCRFAAFARCND